MDTEVESNPEPLFRPVKKRKFLRRRPDHEQEDSQESATEIKDASSRNTQNPPAHTTEETDDVVRLRRPQRTRKGGIEFSTTSRQTTNSGSQAVTAPPNPEETEDDRILAMCDRFTAHTGQTVDVDKHMMDYIETEMARRHRRDMPTDTSDTGTPVMDETLDGGPAASSSNFARREPATIGKLHEIDLGQETKLHNIARTEAATRRLTGNDAIAPVEEDTAESTTAEKDGKQWRSRKRRNSKDIERDRLVEEVLQESKLDVYDEPDDEPLADDQAADDRIAERFRRDFMDAVQSRRRVARAKNTKPSAAKPEAPRGPKLGGSRSARAAMRESQKTQK